MAERGSRDGAHGVSKPTPIFVGTVDAEGVLHLESRQLFNRYVATLKNSVVALTVKKRARPKSHSQLGYLWGVVYPVIAEDLGYRDYEIDALHDAIMRKLRGLKPDPNPLGLRVSLAEMSHEDVTAYIDDVRHWAVADHGIVTPDAQRAESAA